MEDVRSRANAERWEILRTLEEWLETPLLILGFVWLFLLIAEFVWGEGGWMSTIGNVIWAIFIIDFSVKLTLAPKKLKYLRDNWLTAVALALPALRIFRIFRVARLFQAARVTRGVRLVRVLTSVNRGLKALGASFGRHGFPYVMGATLIVLFAGAAGMFAFENEVQNTELDSYASAVWWTAMLLTSIGSESFPKTAEGRLLSFLIALYGFVVFGYLTATLASFFVERDAKAKDSPIPDADSLANLDVEVRSLRKEIRDLSERLAR